MIHNVCILHYRDNFSKIIFRIYAITGTPENTPVQQLYSLANANSMMRERRVQAK
jgi:hypothetical protein